MHERTTMYLQNRLNNFKFNGCSPLQNWNGVISLKPGIAYFACTNHCKQAERNIVELNG